MSSLPLKCTYDTKALSFKNNSSEYMHVCFNDIYAIYMLINANKKALKS